MRDVDVVGTSRWTSADVLLACGLFAGTVAYLASLPTNLSISDEASYLHEAKRLLDGEVMYRDVFDFITPGFQYLMALLFALFGTTITTARVAAAVIHGLIAVALYATCRRLGVRPWLAAAAGVAHLSLDQSSWPIASQHWLSTLLCTLLLLNYAGGVSTEAGAVTGGLVLGLLAVVQQQRALPMAIGTAAWVLADDLLARRYDRHTGLRRVAMRLVLLAGTTAAVALPVLAWCVVRAGFSTVWSALVEFPISSYGATTHCSWGHVNLLTAWQGSFTAPRLLAWLPVAFVVTLSRLGDLVVTGRAAPTARRLLWLVAFAGASAGSIRYFPDFIHIAFIAPVFYAVIAENLEWSARRVDGPLGNLLAVAFLAGIVVVSGAQLARNRSRLWADFPIGVDTVFGHVQFHKERKELELYERIRRLVDATPGLELFVYPAFSSFYLTTGARNPTRYSWYASTFGFPDLVAEAEARRPPYALVLADWKPVDPIIDYVRRTYEPPSPDAPFVGTILRRRPDR